MLGLRLVPRSCYRCACKGCAGMLPCTVGITQQCSRHSTTAYYKYQCPLPILVLGLWLSSPFQTLHLVLGVKYPIFLFSGFTFYMTIIFCVAHPLATYFVQSQKQVKQAWSRLLTCMPWTTLSRLLGSVRVLF